MADDLSQLLKSVVDLWTKQIKLCEDKKRKVFGNAAREVMRYVGKRYERLGIDPIQDGIPQNPSQRDSYLTVTNYTQAAIDILTPYVFAKVPNRLVTPRRPQIPPELEQAVPEAVSMQKSIKEQDTMTCFLLQWLLNWWPKLYNLEREGKMVVREAIAKGRGVLWLQIRRGPEGDMPASECDTVDNFGIDADCRQLRDAGFIYKRHNQVLYKIAEMWGEDVEKLRASNTTAMMQAALEVSADSTVDPHSAQKGDIGTYYEFWSVIGMGEKLVGAPEDMKEPGPVRAMLDQLGPYVHFAIMPGLDHPLGMDPEKLSAIQDPQQLMAMLQAMLAWPIKTYENLDNPWPVYCLDFLPNIDNPWAKSILESSLPLQQFIDRIYQTLMNRATTAGRDIIVTSEEIEEDLKMAIKEGEDLEIVGVQGKVDKARMDELVNFLQFPEVKKDIFEILEWCDKVFREQTGLSQSMFGGIPQSQDRSAEATKTRESGLSRRPDDYADIVEAWMSAVSSGEAVAARMLVSPFSVAPLFGEQIQDATGQPAKEDTPNPVYANAPLTSAWVSLVHTDDPAVAAAECSYSVEAGSGRRRNKQLLQSNAQQIFSMLGSQCYAILEGTGEAKPFIIVTELLGTAYDMALQPLVEAISDVFQRMAQQKAQQGQQQQGPPGPGGAGEGPPGSPENEANKMMAGGSVLARRWQSAAGGPKAMPSMRSQGSM
jgi:hypothetical protein